MPSIASAARSGAILIASGTRRALLLREPFALLAETREQRRQRVLGLQVAQALGVRATRC